jgi:hypothetical protein
MVTGVYFATVVSYSCKLFISPAPDVAAAVIKLLINCHWAKVKCKLIQERERAEANAIKLKRPKIATS